MYELFGRGRCVLMCNGRDHEVIVINSRRVCAVITRHSLVLITRPRLYIRRFCKVEKQLPTKIEPRVFLTVFPLVFPIVDTSIRRVGLVPTTFACPVLATSSTPPSRTALNGLYHCDLCVHKRVRLPDCTATLMQKRWPPKCRLFCPVVAVVANASAVWFALAFPRPALFLFALLRFLVSYRYELGVGSSVDP